MKKNAINFFIRIWPIIFFVCILLLASMAYFLVFICPHLHEAYSFFILAIIYGMMFGYSLSDQINHTYINKLRSLLDDCTNLMKQIMEVLKAKDYHITNQKEENREPTRH